MTKASLRSLLSADYEIPTLGRGAIRLILGYLIANLMVRGFDYLTGVDATKNQQYVEALLPFALWGYLFTLAGALLILGIWLDRHVVVWLGHALAAVFYTGLTIALFQGSLFAFDNWRATAVGIEAVLHFAFATQMKPFPKSQLLIDYPEEEAP